MTNLDKSAKLYDLPNSEFETGGGINELAVKAGYASGKAMVSQLNLWSATVGDVLELLNPTGLQGRFAREPSLNSPSNVHLSNNTSYSAKLVVYRDWIESSGSWRLFWENPNDPGVGVCEQSTVTGQPFFRTMKSAIAHGLSSYGIVAVKAEF